MTPTTSPVQESVPDLGPVPIIESSGFPSPPYDPDIELSLLGWIALGVDRGYCLPASSDADLAIDGHLIVPLA